MQYFKLFTCGLLLCLSLVTDSLNYRDCGSRDVSVMTLRISSCNNEPCLLVRGKTVRIEIEFLALNNVDAEISEIRGSSGHGPPVLQFPEGGICAHLTPPCPIEKRKFYALIYRPKVNEKSTPRAGL
ncbi:hypothetical protein CRM22_003756 [Opisthorchis felineus]|uniref:MD-2-related lipid-recognition domain-containing protein n=1 Tax=Opisthorchis felineus TaxID=147828 RepID=A0A4S2M0B1_OPIFE|nr:hypothetical protein CRM22_003756 [Opisthorchis felineus]